MTTLKFSISIILICLVFFCSAQQSDSKQKSMWSKSIEINTIDRYEKYLKKYPNGEFVKQAKEKIAFLTACEINTTDSYSKFLNKYPNSKDRSFTEERINYLLEIEENKAFSNSFGKPTSMYSRMPEGFGKYLIMNYKTEESINSFYSYYAIQLRLRSSDIIINSDSLFNFIKQYPESKFNEIAKKILVSETLDTYNFEKIIDYCDRIEINFIHYVLKENFYIRAFLIPEFGSNFVFDNTDNLYGTTMNRKDIFKFSYDTTIRILKTDSKILQLLITKNNDLVARTINELIIYNLTSKTLKSYNSENSPLYSENEYIGYMQENEAGQIITNVNGSFYIYDNNNWSYLTSINHINKAENSIKQRWLNTPFVIDSSNIIWVPIINGVLGNTKLSFLTFNGFARFDGKTWANDTIEAKYLGQVVTDMKIFDNDIWLCAWGEEYNFGGGGGGLIIFDGTNYTIFNKDNPLINPKNSFYCLSIDWNNKVWVGTEENIVVFTKNNPKIIDSQINNGSTKKTTIHDVAIDKKNNVWATKAFGGGIIIYNPNGIKFR